MLSQARCFSLCVRGDERNFLMSITSTLSFGVHSQMIIIEIGIVFALKEIIIEFYATFQVQYFLQIFAK